MLAATAAWAAAETLMLVRPRAGPTARLFWTAGIALALVHTALAFHLVHGWSHRAAAIATARQTAEMTGWAWQGGIFVNYAFLAYWFADAWWWWTAPSARAARRQGAETLRLAIFVFMFVNGAVVFASPPGRVVGIASIGAVAIAAIARRRPLPA